MGSRMHKTWSQKHGGMITVAIIAGFISMLVPPLLLLTVPIALLCGGAFLAGYLRVKMYDRPVKDVCQFCGTVEPRNSQKKGWRIVMGILACPQCP